MKNITYEEKNGKLVITVDLEQDLGKSNSGKTTLIATTGKPIRMSLDKSVYFGLNVFKYPPREQK